MDLQEKRCKLFARPPNLITTLYALSKIMSYCTNIFEEQYLIEAHNKAKWLCWKHKLHIKAIQHHLILLVRARREWILMDLEQAVCSVNPAANWGTTASPFSLVEVENSIVWFFFVNLLAFFFCHHRHESQECRIASVWFSGYTTFASCISQLAKKEMLYYTSHMLWLWHCQLWLTWGISFFKRNYFTCT